MLAGAGAEGPEEILEDMIAARVRRSGQEDLQGWVDTDLAESIDGNGGWYIIALDRMGRSVDTAACRRRMAENAGEQIGSMTKRLRMSLTMLALGMEGSFPRETLSEAAETDSLMPLIFARHLSNNGIEGGGETTEKLLSLQKADGGWAVIGDSADPDCTAMAIQALAPLREEEQVRAAVSRGLEALSALQLEGGGYSGMGLESSESCAQVLLALACLGIDGDRDERFVKAGGSVLDALLSFRRADGGFAHSPQEKESNETATVQAFLALAGYRRMLRGEGPCFVFEKREIAPPPATVTRDAEGNGKTEEKAAPAPEGVLPRGPLYLVTGALAVLFCLISWIRKRRNWRTYAFIAALAALAALGIALTEIRTPEGYYGAGEREYENGISTLISIRCDTVAGRNEWAPADGVILEETEIRIEEGRSAFDQLLEATRLHHIQMEYDGTAEGAYIRGIGYLYEYNFGNLSGWMYRVNGAFADVGASRYTLREGDRVEWIYTTDIGRDAD